MTRKIILSIYVISTFRPTIQSALFLIQRLRPIYKRYGSSIPMKSHVYCSLHVFLCMLRIHASMLRYMYMCQAKRDTYPPTFYPKRYVYHTSVVFLELLLKTTQQVKGTSECHLMTLSFECYCKHCTSTCEISNFTTFNVHMRSSSMIM